MRVRSKILLLFLIAGLVCCASQEPLSYPETKKGDQVDDYFGAKVEAPYRWLEDLNSEETKKWIEAQVSLTGSFLDGIKFRSKVRDRLTEIWNYERYTVPYREGDYYIFSKNDGLQEQSVVYIQKGLNGNPEVLIDPNTFSEDGSVSLTGVAFSKDHKFLCYGISRGGSDWREFYVMEVETRNKLDDHIQWIKFAVPTWYKQGFFYSRYDEPRGEDKLKIKLENQKLFYHRMGTDQSQDMLIYHEPENPRKGFSPYVTDDEQYLILTIWEGAADYNMLYYKNLKTNSKILPIIDDPEARYDFIDAVNDRFLVMTDFGAPRWRLVSIDPNKPQKAHWVEILPESENTLDRVSSVGGYLVASYLKHANTSVAVFDLKGEKLHDVDLSDIGTAYGFNGRKSDSEVFYAFTSFVSPPVIFRYNLKENTSTLFKKTEVRFNSEDFETKQVFYESKDRTKVPLFILHRKGLELDGRNPALLYGYGGFNIEQRPRFVSGMIPLLENNGVYALACLRGGSEYGESWHKAGMLEDKQNVFDDFIAAAEYLIENKYTSQEKLAIYGASNGGLLVGAAMTQRPDLFKVAIPAVGVMDMLRYHKFTIGWAWTGEYGSSDDPDQFAYLYKYSPLHNIKEGVTYPATLVTTADHDDRVFPAHSFKFIAALQEKHEGKDPVLIRIETKVGHGAGTSTSKSIELFTDILSFMFHNMKINFEAHE